jgi:hypothetical protein
MTHIVLRPATAFPRAAALAALTGLLAATTPAEAAAQLSAAGTGDSTASALSAFGLTREGIELNGRYVRGGTTVARGDTVQGPLVVVGGTAEVSGVVAGSVYALWGDVVVHDGAVVRGSAHAWRGRVVLDGGRILGAISATPTGVVAGGSAEPEPVAAPITRLRALQLGGGWTAMALVVGLLVLVLLSANLERTARVLEEDFGRAFFAGVIGQLGFLPALVVLCIALAATVVGILLIPFALVAAPVALAGFVTLGWLALALSAGRGLLRMRAAGSSRADAVRALAVGVLLLMGPWLLLGALWGTGTVTVVARIAALAITWVAGTAGLGAALLSRGGTARARRETPSPAAVHGWQTPTPVSGVAAARRPIPARPGATPE